MNILRPLFGLEISKKWLCCYLAALLLRGRGRGRTCNPCQAFAPSASLLVRYTPTTPFLKLSSSKIVNNICSPYLFLLS